MRNGTSFSVVMFFNGPIQPTPRWLINRSGKGFSGLYQKNGPAGTIFC
jgi:hypothetical protein